jgi:hypothetical protein
MPMPNPNPDDHDDLTVSESTAAVGPGSTPTLWVDLRAALTDRLVWILGLAAFFDGISDNWVHAVLLGSVAVAVGRDAGRQLRGIAPAAAVPLLRTPATGSARRWAVVAVVALVGYAAATGQFARYSWPATAAVLLPATAVLTVAWQGPWRPAPVPQSPDPGGARAWAILFVAAGVWELVALLQQPTLQVGSQAHPTISFLMDPVLATSLGRSVALAGWLACGWWLLVRAPAAPRGEAP